MVISGRLIVHAPGQRLARERSDRDALRQAGSGAVRCHDGILRARAGARIEDVGKSQSCMVSKVRTLSGAVLEVIAHIGARDVTAAELESAPVNETVGERRDRRAKIKRLDAGAFTYT